MTLEAVKEIVADWILVTYDLPSTKEGLTRRHDFLRAGKYAGAVQHSESVYYMPMTQVAVEAITKLSEGSGGAVFVWYTKAASESLAQQLTTVYDKQVLEWIEKVGERVPKISEHLAKGHMKMASNMIEKTEEALDVLLGIIIRRGSQKLFESYQSVKKHLNEVAN